MEKRGLYLYVSEESKNVLLDEIEKREGRWGELFGDNTYRWHGHKSLTGLLDTILSLTPAVLVKGFAMKIASIIPVGSSPN